MKYNNDGYLIISSIQYTHPLIYEKAVKYSTQYHNSYHDAQTIMHGFSWSSTDENQYFWEHINYGRFADAKQLYPELFIDHLNIITNKKFNISIVSNVIEKV